MRDFFASVLLAALAGAAVPAGAQNAPAQKPSPPGWLCGPGPFTGVGDTVTPFAKDQTNAPPPAQPSSYVYKVIATGLEHPWSLAFLPDGKFLISERTGRLRVVDADGKISAPLAGLPPILPEQGLHDLLLDRDFARTRGFYFTYFAPPRDGHKLGGNEYRNWVLRPLGQHELGVVGTPVIAHATLSTDLSRIENVKTIFEGADKRLAWGPDGKLYATESDPGALGDVHTEMEPQQPDTTFGKVLRLNPDGSIPRDNPFVDRAGYNPALYDLGHRDLQGLAFDAKGQLWTSEHGPRGGDEINLIRPGRNYGFPVISYGREYSGELINGGKTVQQGMEQPVYFWVPSIGPSGITFYTGNMFPNWRNSLFVSSQPGRRLIRLELKNNRVVAEEQILADRCKRVRDVQQGPDGALYVVTEEQDGELIRIAKP